MERLIRKCESITEQVKYLLDYAESLSKLGEDPKKLSAKGLDQKAECLESYKCRYEKTYEELYETASKEQLTQIKAEYVAFQKLCTKTYELIQAAIVTHFPVEDEVITKRDSVVEGNVTEAVLKLVSAQEKQTSELLSSIRELMVEKSKSVSGSGQETLAKLPQLDLKSFSGGYSEWTEFIDIFTCAVHDRRNLAPVQKLQYLKSCLEGEALDVIKGLTLKDENYAIAIGQLRMRYDNVKTIRDTHFSNIFNLTSIQAQGAANIRKLCLKMFENVQALGNLKEPIRHWDSWLVYVLKVKLDQDTRLEFERHFGKVNNPTFEDSIAFLNDLANAMELSLVGKSKRQLDANISGNTRPKVSNVQVSATMQDVCFLCEGKHRLPTCERFLALSPELRKTKVFEMRLCLNCFSRKHFVANCPMPGSCSQCNGKHHPTLHFLQGSDPQNDAIDIASHIVKPTPVACGQEVLLNTALVYVYSGNGQPIPCRVLLDPGSQMSFVSTAFAQRARLKQNRIRNSVNVTGIGCTSRVNLDSYTDCIVSSAYKDNRISIQALIIDRVTGTLPRQRVVINDWSELRGLQLADKQYDTPRDIDMLIGADIYPHVLLQNQRRSPDGKILAQETLFGWVLCGVVQVIANSGTSNCTIMSHFIDTESENTDDILKRFWEIETAEQACAWSYEEKDCESHFLQTHDRDYDGRYVVTLPFKDGPMIGESRSRAVKRLKQMEQKLNQDLDKLSKYSEVMNEYFDLGHAEPVPAIEIENTSSFYLPHHCVIKESSTTTKLRIVFDASAKSSTGVSLNDRLMVGPKVQNDLVDILTRFRTHPVAVTADIAKMYRQLRLNGRDKDYHRFVWRESRDEPVKDYRMTVVTFGVVSSPYQAQRILKQLTQDERKDFPLAAPAIERDTYMDDFLSGERNSISAIRLSKQAIDICERGGFELRKWISNDKAVMDAIPPDKREVVQTIDMDLDKNAVAKTLGVFWNPHSDVFMYQINIDDDSDMVTKRQLLAQSALVFDPLGLVTPTMMVAKIMFQQLWLHGINWDEAVPSDIRNQWLKWRNELKQLENLNIERCIVPKDCDVLDFQLHGFGDASEKGYAACVFLRSVASDGTISVKLVRAKTKVAPIKQVSLPRLELCAALLNARLLSSVKDSLNLPAVGLHAWSDSTVTLCWIRSSPSRLKTFVANRVSDIQDIMNPSSWRYCPTEENPSDCASRGIFAKDLVTKNLWWYGPGWLSKDVKQWPQFPPQMCVTESKALDTEMRCHVAAAKSDDSVKIMDLFSYSLYSKVVRIAAWCLRWLNRIRNRGSVQRHYLSVGELRNSLKCVVKCVQRECFSEDYDRLRAGDDLVSKSRLRTLCPFIDQDGVLRVGGRLQNANLPFQKRHPILLPKKHAFITLLIIYEHKINLHAMPQLLLAVLRQRFWILCARDCVRSVISHCIKCRKHQAKAVQQFMGSLPAERVTPARPFSTCGVDYAGPLLLKIGGSRSRASLKCWIAVFVCFVVKAIHLEIVSGLTTDAFLAALRRFVSRRGKPQSMYSDHGTNFVGAKRELSELKRLLESEKHNEIVSRELGDQGISWHYSPERGPHFGGLWEAGVKSVKTHLSRVVGGNKLTFEEMSTVLCQIEACLNSRPLSAMSADPSDLNALTPGHFLITSELNALPEPCLLDVKLNRLNRWQHLQTLHQHFWSRWSTEYLCRLQQRPKWTKTQRNVEKDDLVVIMEDNLPPTCWLLARVVELHPGRDGLVRVVSVRTKSGVFKRPVVKLCLLFPADSKMDTLDTC